VLSSRSSGTARAPRSCACPRSTRPPSVETLHEAGFKLIIMANHAIRSSIKAMTETLTTLRQERATRAASTTRSSRSSASTSLVGVDKMKRGRRELPAFGQPGRGARRSSALGQSQGLLPLTELPKPMLDIKGKTILERQIEVLNDVRREGHRRRARLQEGSGQAPERPLLRQRRLRLDQRGGLAVRRQEGAEAGRSVVLYGDILFERGHLEKLLKSPADITLLVDPRESYAQIKDERPKAPWETRGEPDLVSSRTRRRRATASSAPTQPHLVAASAARSTAPGARRVRRHGDVQRRRARARSPTSGASSARRKGDGQVPGGRVAPRRVVHRSAAGARRQGVTRSRPSTSTRAGSRSTRSRTTDALGRCSRSERDVSRIEGALARPRLRGRAQGERASISSRACPAPCSRGS
jgi:hypothetical protein